MSGSTRELNTCGTRASLTVVAALGNVRIHAGDKTALAAADAQQLGQDGVDLELR